MNDEIIYNVASAFILSIIFAALVFRRVTKGRINRAFIYLVLSTFITVLFNIGEILIDGDTAYSNSLKVFLSIGYYICRNISFAMYGFFVVALTDTAHVFQKGIRRAIMGIPLVITVISSCSALFCDFAFYVDANGYFVRGKGVQLIYLCNAIYVLYAVVIIHMYMNTVIGKARGAALLTCGIAALVAYVVSARFPAIHFDLIFYTLGILFIMLIVQNPELRVDSQSGLNRHAAYFDDVRTGYVAKKPMVIIQVNIIHFERLTNMLSYEKVSVLIRYLSSRITLMCKRLNLSCETYYIKDGFFRVAVNKSSFSDVEKASKVLYNMFNSSASVNDIKVELNSIVVISKIPEDFGSFEELYDFENGLRAMINTKDVMYASDLINNDEYRTYSHLDEAIERGLSEGGFEVYYQPIYNVRSRCFTSCEALLRLHDSKYGDIVPDQFIPVAEKNGSIDRLGCFVLEEICKFIKDERFASLGIENIGMNFSVMQGLIKDYSKKVLNILSKYGVSPEMINLEITESIATESQKVFTDNIIDLANAGMLISFDDYGTGYSNISTISSLPLSSVKFDRSFVNTNGNEKLEGILDSSIEMIHSFGKQIVVEGVESEELFRKFDFLDCDFIQGFYFSEAIPKEQFISYIKESKSNN